MLKNFCRTRLQEVLHHEELLAGVLLILYLLNEVVQTIGRFLLTRLSIYGTPRFIILLIPTLIPPLLFLLLIRKFQPRKYVFPICVLLAAAAAFGLTLLLHPDYEYFFTRDQYGIARVFQPNGAIYAFLFFSLVDDPKLLRNVMVKMAYISFANLVIFSLIPALMQGYWTDVYYDGRVDQMTYNLTFGYEMLFPTFVFFYMFYRCRKIHYGVLGLCAAVITLTQGSRGAMLLMAIFVALMVVSNVVDTPKENHKRRNKILVGCGILLAAIVVGIPLIKLSASVLQDVGLDFRTLRLLAEGTFLQGNGREEIWQASIEGIRQGGFFGNGAFGDRPFVYSIHYAGYSHNLFLELICSFGVIGAVLSVGIIWQSLRMIFCCKVTLWRELFIIYFAIACQLLLSLSFWYVSYFWAAAAIAHKYFQLQRRNLLDVQK